MEESKALRKILEGADLIAMVEEMLNKEHYDQLSTTSKSAMRITLRGIRENMLASHDILAARMINRAQAAPEPVRTAAAPQSAESAAEMQRQLLSRKDLRSALERIVENKNP